MAANLISELKGNRFPDPFASTEIRSFLERPTEALSDYWTGSESSVLGSGTVARMSENDRGDLLESTIQRGQQVAVAAGITGFRPEQFAVIKDTINIDVRELGIKILGMIPKELKEKLRDKALELILALIEEAVEIVSKTVALTVLNAIPVVGWIIAIVLEAAFTIAGSIKDAIDAKAAIAKALMTCLSPGMSASADYEESYAALQLMAYNGDWSELFYPTVNPNRYGTTGTYGGFTCCISALHDGRVIAPLGIGYGAPNDPGSGNQASPRDNKWPGLTEEAFGMLPMCPLIGVHRALDKAPGQTPIDIGQRMPQTTSVGMQAWSMMWSGGPTAFSVDGRAISDAWFQYLMRMRSDIVNNFEHRCGKDSTKKDRKAGYWEKDSRIATMDWFEGMLTEGGVAKGIGKTAPVLQWYKFGAYQQSLLQRLTIAYVDSRAAGAAGPEARVCHPAWRAAVDKAQRDLLEHPTAVCRLDRFSIPNPEYRAAVELRMANNESLCKTFRAIARQQPKVPLEELATSGPSLASWDDKAPPMPRPPELATSTRGGARNTPGRTTPGAPSTHAPQPGRLGSTTEAEKKLAAAKRAAVTEDKTNWTLVTIGTLGVVGVGGYIWHRKRKR